MSALKTELRMWRLKKEDNLLTDCPDEVIGHELEIGRQDIENDLGIKHLIQNKGNPTPRLQRRYFYKILGVSERSKWITHDKPPSPKSGNVNTESHAIAKLLNYRSRLMKLTDP